MQLLIIPRSNYLLHKHTINRPPKLLFFVDWLEPHSNSNKPSGTEWCADIFKWEIVLQRTWKQYVIILDANFSCIFLFWFFYLWSIGRKMHRWCIDDAFFSYNTKWINSLLLCTCSQKISKYDKNISDTFSYGHLLMGHI